MKVLIYSAKDFEIPYLEEANNRKHQLTFTKDALSSQTAMIAVGYDIEEKDTLKTQYNMEYMSLKDLCNRADIISLHVPLNADTHELINEDLIEEMKDGVILINTARGSVIDTEAIIAGLKSEKIGALGIDVYENEKNIFFKDHSQKIPNDNNLMLLNTMPNVLITGHHAFLTDEALTNIAETTIYNLNCYYSEKTTDNELTVKE